MEDRYYSFAEYCKNEYGRRLYRVALNAHMTCPNRDGTCGTSGCIFCGRSGSGDFAIDYDGQKLVQQDLIYNHQKAKPGDYIAYFQAYTNTYDRPERLERLYRSALDNDLFAGIDIATRPDCLGEDVMAILRKLKREYPDKFIWIELGLQTIHEKTAAWMRRGYFLPVFDQAVRNLKEAGIAVIVHIILGLPQESSEMVLQTVGHLNSLGINGIKIHLLHYTRDSDLGDLYLRQPESFDPMSLESYTDLVCDCLAHLNRDIMIHRLTGDGNGDELLAPLWSKDKKKVINLIRHKMKEKNYVHGCMV